MEKRKAQCFEELRCYQGARILIKEVYALTRQPPFCRDFELVRQVRRAAVSIISNIAEGYERGSRTELVQFLFIAKGSCGEVRAQLQVAHDIEYINADQFRQLYAQCKEISSMISALISTVQQSDYKGEKFHRQ